MRGTSCPEANDVYAPFGLLSCSFSWGAMAHNVWRVYAAPFAAQIDQFLLQQTGWNEHNTKI
jgi:hypothetical protein